MLQFALAGSLHAVCNLRQFASPQSLGAGTPPFGVQVGARAVQPAHPGKPVQAATVGPLQKEKENKPQPNAVAGTRCSSPWRAHCTLCAICAWFCKPSKHQRGPWHSHHCVAWVVCGGGEVGVPRSFGREKAALFESLGKIFRTSMCTHLPPPPPNATVSHQNFTLFRRIVVYVDGKRPSNFQGHS